MKMFLKKLTSMFLAVATTIVAANLTPLAQSVSATSFSPGQKVSVTCEGYFPYSYDFRGSGLIGIYGLIPKLSANEQIAYCDNSLKDSGDSGAITPFTVIDTKGSSDLLTLAIAYGYTGRTKYGFTEETERLATQIMVWCIQDDFYDNDKESTALNLFTANMGSTLASNVKTVYGKIKMGIKSFSTKSPSFNDNRKELVYNSSTDKWSLTLTDNNGVVSNFDWASAVSSYSYLSVSVSGNNVTFTSTRAFNTETLKVPFKQTGYTAVKAVQLAPDPGYSNQQDCITHEVNSDPPTATIKLYAEEQEGSLKLIKTSEDGKTEGIGFRVLTSGGTLIGTYYTDANGTFTVNDLIAGDYIVEEIVPDGYTKQNYKRVTVEPGKTAEVSFSNTLQKGTLKIIKTSEDGKVSGISFKVYAKSGVIGIADNTLIGTYTTDSKGEIKIPNLKVGTYTITEIVPEGYQADPTGSTKIVTVKENETTTVSFKNIPVKGELKIIKTSPIDNGKVSGIKFIVAAESGVANVADGTVLGTYTTDSNGEILIPGLKVGTYKITEIVPEGYKPQNPKTVTVKENETAEVSFRNVPDNIGTMKIVKTSDDNRVANIIFIIKTKDGKLVGEYRTKAEVSASGVVGVIDVQLMPGEYVVTEKNSPLYKPQEPQTVTVETGKTTVVNFHNIVRNGAIQLTKVDESDPDMLLSGAVFSVSFSEKMSSVGGTDKYSPFKVPLGNMEEISEGVYYIGDLKEGMYYITETKAPKGYELDTNTYAVKVTDTKKSYIVTNNDNGLFTNRKPPQITTLAASQSGGNAFAAGRITIEDTVSYKNLIVGKTYTVKGYLMQPSFDWDKRETGVPFTVGGKQITAEKTFTASASEGRVTLSFTFETKEITQNTKVVVFEELYAEGKDEAIASHKDINDKNQTVEIHKPKITTSATSYNRKDVMAVGTITIDDSIEYTDLIVGESYTVKGTLMDKSTGKAFAVNGKAVEAQTTFTATATAGTVAVRFTFNASGITKNTQAVAYERLYYNNIEIAAHTDINDKSQTVEILKPQISTTATSMNEKHAFGIGTVTIDDAVEYSNLIEEQEYVLVGVLMDKTTGKPFKLNGKTVEARTAFTAKAQSGTAAVRFAFDGSAITENTKLVVYETLYRNGTEIASHKDINDKGQTVEIHKPSIDTTATTSDGKKEAIAGGIVFISDTISYKDLIVGKEYVINGVLMNKATGKPFTVNGKEVTAQYGFTPETPNAAIIVSFLIDTSEITANTELVSFQTLYMNDVEIASHKDINDKDQTVEFHKPKIKTTATSNGEKDVIAVGTVTIDDVVSYEDLMVGKEYTVNGVLMDKTTGKAFTVNGKEVTAQAKFTPTTTNGTVSVKFTFDGSAITANTKLVAYERLYLNKTVIAVHTDINDKAQTVEVHKPTIGTIATSNGEKETMGVGTVTINDTVAYHDLIIGKEYTVSGTLMNQATGRAFTVNGKEVTSSVKFTAKAADETVTVSFAFDGSAVTENTKLVVFETLYLGSTAIAVHADINDKGQTVEIHKPEIKTTATSKGEKEVIAIGTVTIDDIVSYKDLIIGKEYTVNGVLMNKATGEAFTVNGKEVTAQAKFTPTTTNGTVSVKFTFDGSTITANTKLVAYERLYLKDVEIAVHTDINDNAQTVELHKPEIKTTATSNGEKEAIGVGTVTIDDAVSYKDLIVGREYTVNGVLMNKTTGKAFTVNGKEVTAQAKFTPKTTSGTVTVSFTFDANGITANTKLVAYERLYLKDVEIAVHTDINDNAQTVELHKPSIGTTANANGEKETVAVGNITVVDTVAYHDLIIGKEYTISGVLINKATGKPFTVNGKEIASTVKFTAKAADENVSVSFTFDSSEITANTKLVAFQTLYLNGVEIASHKDINDKGQTVEIHKPEIKTTATSNGEKEAIAVGTVTIDDVISYKDLIVGKEYTVNGVLINKTTGKAFTVNGKEVTAQAKFTPKTTSGTVTVSFTFDGSAITANTKLVAYERLSLNGVEIAVHTDINDKAQTVELHKPEIKTTATSNGEKEAIAVGTVTIDDVVSYKDLIVGKEYTVNGVLMNKTTGKAFIVNGKEVTAQTKFTPKTTSGTLTVSFTFNANGITANTKLVAYECLYLRDVEIAVHTDINDNAQTVELHKPEIRTTATSNGEKEAIAVGTVTIDDAVSYKDLIVGREYTVNGVLMNKTTGKAFTVNGKEVTAQAKFTPAASSGTVTVSFTFDGSAITANTKLVAYERLSLNGVEIAVHTDINDEEQTVEVHKPKIGTTAAANGEKEAIAVGEITVIDTVDYHDLIIGREYKVIGVLMDKTTGKPFTVNGAEVTAQTVFTAEKTDENVSVSFTFDSNAITENTKLVAFQTLYLNGVEIANHRDINDEGQTVEIHKPEIGTSASSEGEKEAFVVGTVTIEDIVKYHDLIIGKEYVVYGVLMNKATNEPFLVDGEEVTAQTTFIAENSDGEVIVTFTFDASGITENMTVVAFETMSLDGVEFAVHADINDEEQTVELRKPKISTVATIDGQKDAFAVGETVIKDIIYYENLIVGKEYTINGVIMNKLTGEPLLINGERVTAQTIFTAHTAKGEIETSFTFDGKGIAENTTLVVFETLSYGEAELTAHTDISDENQTVGIKKSEVDTKASIDYTVEDGKVYIVVDDIITFKSLIPGKEYTVKGVLMDKLTGQPFLVNGEQITVEKTFIAEAADGEITVSFFIDSDLITQETDMVVFEAIYSGEKKVAEHADITDTDQSVTLVPIEEEPPLGDAPPTGFGIGMGIIGAFGLAAAAVVVFGRRRKK